VQQKLDALHSDSEVIQVFGDHIGKKTNKDVIAVRIHSRNVYYFSSGYEKFFTNLQVIQVYSSKLKFITQRDLMPFTKLKHLDLNKNDLEVLEKELFKYNTELEVIKVSENKLRFIDVTAFEGLFSLHTIELNDNHCIWKATPSNDDLDEEEDIGREDAIDVLYEVRTRCYRDYILKELLDMEMGRNLRERSVIVTKLESRVEDLMRQNDAFYDRMKKYKDELDECQSKEINKGEEMAMVAMMMAEEAKNDTMGNGRPKYESQSSPQNSIRPQEQGRSLHSNGWGQQQQQQQFIRPNQLQMTPTRRESGRANNRYDSWEREGRSTGTNDVGNHYGHSWRH
jgi:hypothetical protein